jgi:predicted RND superfamily exporter protein
MTNFRERVASHFERWSDYLFYHNKRVIAVCLLLMIGFASQMPSLRVDTTIEGFLEKDNPAMVIYDQFRDQFGRDDRIIIGVRTRSLFEAEFLERLRDFHMAIESQVDYLDDVESLINARAVYGTQDELIVEDLFEHWPESRESMRHLEEYAAGNPLYQNLLLSADSRFTLVRVKLRRYAEDLDDAEVLDELNFEDPDNIQSSQPPLLLTEDQNDAVVRQIFRVVDEFNQDDFELFASGQPVLTHLVKTAVVRDMQFFVVVGFITIACLLFIVFRTISAVIPPLIVVLCALISTLSCMAMAGAPIQIPTQILPSFLLAIGVADSVHILTIFHQHLRQGRPKAVALKYAMGHAGVPIVFTSLTTAGGLMSFLSSDLAPVSTIGIFAPLGVMFAFFYSVVLLPALVAMLPAKSADNGDQETLSGTVLVQCGRFSIRHPGLVIGITAALTFSGFYFASQIRFSHNPLNWFPEQSELRVATATIDAAMAGTMSMEILIDKKEDYAFHNPENLNRLSELAESAEATRSSVVQAGQAVSITDVLKEVHKGLNENRQDYYRLADNRPLISQELLLFENSGSEDLEELVDTVYSKARLTLIVNWADALEYKPFVDKMRALALQHFSDEEITITGLLPILSQTFSILIRSIMLSYGVALIVIIPLMMLMVGSIKTGSLAMAPNIIPILLCLGFMSLVDIPIDGFTLLIGGVAIGLVVDDTIHFLHHFKRYLDATGSVEEAVIQTLQTTGRAMLFTTIILVCGFATFTISSMMNLTYFGMLTALTVTLALFADILLMPALVSIFFKAKRQS